jgi:hypothetical protein
MGEESLYCVVLILHTTEILRRLAQNDKTDGVENSKKKKIKIQEFMFGRFE